MNYVNITIPGILNSPLFKYTLHKLFIYNASSQISIRQRAKAHSFLHYFAKCNVSGELCAVTFPCLHEF